MQRIHRRADTVFHALPLVLVLVHIGQLHGRLLLFIFLICTSLLEVREHAPPDAEHQQVHHDRAHAENDVEHEQSLRLLLLLTGDTVAIGIQGKVADVADHADDGLHGLDDQAHVHQRHGRVALAERVELRLLPRDEAEHSIPLGT